MKNTNGITLIALVITIIVLLILAGVSINTIVGESGILVKVKDAKEQTENAGELEDVQIIISGIILEKNVNEEITIDDLENALDKYKDDDLSVDNAERGEKYKYIITIGKNEYGVTEDNQVEKYKGGIKDKYIEISEVTEMTPIYSFTNTVKQKDIDEETGLSNAEYEVIGISLEESGEYTTDAIVGKSGILNIVNLQNADFTYTLTSFMMGDEVFYVKIKIGDDVEKIQKLFIIQGDIVKYEECFAGITYNGDWIEEKSEEFSGGKAKYTQSPGIVCQFECLGYALDMSTIADENSSVIYVMIKNLEVENASTRMVSFTLDSSLGKTHIKLSETKLNDILYFSKGVNSSAKHDVQILHTVPSGTTKTIYVDCIWIYK